MILYEQPSRGGLQVVAYAPARAGLRSGIRAGMPLAEAIALHEHARCAAAAEGHQPAYAGRSEDQSVDVGRWESLHLEAYDPVADRLALAALARECQQFSPLVSLEDAPRPSSLLLDVSGVAGLFGGEARLAGLVAGHLTQQGWTARLAIADSVGAAWAVAHDGRLSAPRVVLPGESQAALAALPTAALRLSPATVTMLAELGVRQIGPLAALPRDTLLGRFGAEPLWRLDQALAGASDTASAEKAIESLTVQRLFEFATDRLETIAAALDQLLAQLIGLLAGDHRGILRLAGRLDRVGAAPLEFEVGLYRPSVSRRHLLELLRLRLEGLRFAAQRAPVEGLRLTVTAAAPLVSEQQALFDSGNPLESPRQLAALVDRLASRLGRQAVLRPCLLDDAQPEYACQYLPLDAQPPQPRQQIARGQADARQHGQALVRRDGCSALPRRQPAASGRCACCRLRSRWRPRRSRRMGRRLAFVGTAACCTSCGLGARSASRRAGGDRPACRRPGCLRRGAIITAWRPAPAAASGCFAVCMTAAGFCTASSCDRLPRRLPQGMLIRSPAHARSG